MSENSIPKDSFALGKTGDLYTWNLGRYKIGIQLKGVWKPLICMYKTVETW